METTQRFGLPLLVYGQGQKDMTHNEAVVGVDCLLHAHIESAGLQRPPVDPDVGAAWLVGAPAEEEWAGREGQIAFLSSAGWRFFRPAVGLGLWNSELGRCQRFDGADWRLETRPVLTAPAGPVAEGGAVIDVQARAVLAAIVARFVELGIFAES